MFQESAPGAPQAIREWFYAGNPAGEQFVYPKRQAIELAKANRTTVPASDDGKTVTEVDANGNTRDQSQVAAANTAPPALPPPASNNNATSTPRANTNPAPANPAPANRAPAAAPQTTGNAPAQQQQQQRPQTLPQTASPLEWVGLLSLVSLAGGFAAGRVRRRA
jgi:hypothetical protein